MFLKSNRGQSDSDTLEHIPTFLSVAIIERSTGRGKLKRDRGRRRESWDNCQDSPSKAIDMNLNDQDGCQQQDFRVTLPAVATFHSTSLIAAAAIYRTFP